MKDSEGYCNETNLCHDSQPRSVVVRLHPPITAERGFGYQGVIAEAKIDYKHKRFGGAYGDRRRGAPTYSGNEEVQPRENKTTTGPLGPRADKGARSRRRSRRS